MGRSYSFHPFHTQQPALGVQGSEQRLGNDEDKTKVAQQHGDLPEMHAGFRHPNAETVERYQAKAAEREEETEDLKPPDDALEPAAEK